MASEDNLIRRIARAVPAVKGSPRRARWDGIRVGIGDDAAVIPGRGKVDQVLTCDTFLEGIHFMAETYPAESVGYKALMRATSDLVAMGATPRHFLLTLAIPANREGRWLESFLLGMRRAANMLKMRLIGGDTTCSPSIFISITAIGDADRELAVTRAGARSGDAIYVSGTLGRAQLGLELMQNDPNGAPKDLLQPHLYPRIRPQLGSWLARNRIASAMMDLSDGLSTDLARLCESSGVGARVFADRMPCVQIPANGLKKLSKLNPLRMALDGGEDYELLFAVPKHKESRLEKAPGFNELTAIGQIMSERKVVIVNTSGKARLLRKGGWDPFRKAKTKVKRSR
jgi:thiamine-monophosphate kinase